MSTERISLTLFLLQQESEIKHGRVCMLGVVGLIVPEFFHLPMYNSGATVYDNAFTVRTHKVPSPTHPHTYACPI